MATETETARLEAFVQATEADERNWIAFLEFESAIHSAAMTAMMQNPYDVSDFREKDELELPISEMLFRVLPRVDLGTILANVAGIGYAIRYGVIEAKGNAIDNITDNAAFEALAERGQAAEQADTDRRMEELRARDQNEKD